MSSQDPQEFKATVIVPLLCQHDQWLRDSIESALKQSVRCQAIVVCSPLTPASNHAVLEELHNSFDNLKILVQEKGEGFADAINTGFMHAQTDRVGLLLSDDYLLPRAVETCLEKIADIVTTGIYTQTENHKLPVICFRPHIEHLNRLDTLEARASYLSHFFLFKRSAVLAVGGVDRSIGLTGADDYDLIWTLLENGATVDIVSEPLYIYRDHSGERLSLKEPAIQIRALQKIFDKHGVTGSKRHQLLQSHAAWFGIRLETGLESENIVFSIKPDAPIVESSQTKVFYIHQLGSNTGTYEKDELRCEAARHETGHCIFGPGYVPIFETDYHVQFMLSVTDYVKDGSVLFTIDIYDSVSDTIIAIKNYSANEYEQQDIALEFSGNCLQVLEFRVFWHGNNTLTFRSIAVSTPHYNQAENGFHSAQAHQTRSRSSSESINSQALAVDVLTSDPTSFVKSGLRESDYFSHDVICIQKSYPDSHLIFQNAGIISSECVSGRFIQLNLYSTKTDHLPTDLWTDHDLNWHRQQMKRPGLVGTAGIFLTDSNTALVSILQSDLLQQLYRHPEFASYRTTIEGTYKAWYKLLWNAILIFARNHRISTVYGPTSETVSARTRQSINHRIFRRIYDYPLKRYGLTRVQINEESYWKIEIDNNLPYLSDLKRSSMPIKQTKRICLMHDIEADVDTDIPFDLCIEHLRRMLDIEQKLDLPSTYNLLGKYFSSFMEVLRPAKNIAIGFHSYDHRIENLDQLSLVRDVNLQIQGYRPPQSILTSELTDYRLSYYNFEWLANSAYRFGFNDCRLTNGIVKIPIATDDYPLFTGEMDFDSWATDILARANEMPFFALSLHDCYARHWLDGYEDLLRKLSSTHEFINCDQIAAEMFVASSHLENSYDA
ncbi:MAG: hypothetical protein DHS20C01_35240 [marine bacterium B5-7]|nr:MAG: hypothetical protein DHS20C01_35240 [marine bacterium B5-7]